MEKLVSVIMGVYNIPSKKILCESIESILNQTYKNLEFIIVDDGSTNETYKWLKEISKKDDRIIIGKNKHNMGLAVTLNKCLKMSSGYYIARMDGDDVSDINRLKKEIDFLEKNKDYKLVTCNMNCFDENGIWSVKKGPEIIKKKDFLFNSPINHAGLVTYKDVYELSNFYNEKNYALRIEDYDLFMRMFSKNIKMYTIQETLYNYREDKDAFSRRKYRYRINEFIVRLYGFHLLKLYPLGIIYVFKPLIVGLIPYRIIKFLRKRG